MYIAKCVFIKMEKEKSFRLETYMNAFKFSS